MDFFSASKEIAQFLSSVNLLPSTNKTALLYTLCWQFYLEKSKQIKKKDSVIHRISVHEAGISNCRFVNISGVNQPTQGQIIG